MSKLLINKDGKALLNDSGKVYTSEGIIPSGTLAIDSNGTHQVREYESVEVNVKAEIDHTIEDKIITGELSGLYVNKRVTKLCAGVFEYRTKLTGVSIPNVTHIGRYALNVYGGNVKFFDIAQEHTVCVLEEMSGFMVDKVLVPDNLIETYKNATNWSSMANKIIARTDGFLNKEKLYEGILLNKSIIRTIFLNYFENTPSVEVISSNENVATISDIVVSTSNIQYKINGKSLGTTNITLKVKGDFDFNYTFECVVYDTTINPSYSVEAVDGSTYGFALNENGYYESQNKGVSLSYAMCKLKINDTQGGLKRVILDCVNYGEDNFDFGIISNINEMLGLTFFDDTNSMYSFKGQSSPNVVSIDCGLVNTKENFICIKYIKDASGDYGNDTLQFKVRFEEV